MALIKQLESQVSLKNFWTMFYKHEVNSLVSKNFYFDGTQKEALERAQEHCKIMCYRLSYVKPMLGDLELEEGIQLGKIDIRTLLPFNHTKETAA